MCGSVCLCVWSERPKKITMVVWSLAQNVSLLPLTANLKFWTELFPPSDFF